MIQKIRETQKTHLVNIFGGVIDAQSLNKDEAQVVIANGNHLKSLLSETTRNFVQKTLWQGNVYPKDYRRKPVDRQINIIGKAFGLSTEEALKFAAEKLPNIKLPRHAEGWFAIPSVQALAAKYFPQVTGDVDQYRECVRFAMKKLMEVRTCSNYELGYFNHHPLMERPKLLNALNGWNMGWQKGDIVLIPAQLGMRFKGKSINEATQAFAKKEFPLGMFEVLSLLLTHPKRFGIYAGLSMVCADNAIAYDGKPLYPQFWMDTSEPSIGARVNFQCRTAAYETREYHGIVSGFTI